MDKVVQQEKCLLSLIIPIYNTERFLYTLLESIFNQITKECELIIINDGSTDGSLEIITKYIEKFRIKGICVKFINQVNHGLSYSRNIGTDNAVGSYLFYVDSDDDIFEWSLEKIISYLNELKTSPTDVLTFDYKEISDQQEVIKSINTHKGFYSPFDVIEYIPNALSGVWRYIVRSNFISDNNICFRNDVYCEDIEWTTQIFLKAKSCLVCDELIYKYKTDRNESIMNSVNDKKIIDAIDNLYISMKIIKRQKKEVSDSNGYEKLYSALSKQYLYNLSFVDLRGAYFNEEMCIKVEKISKCLKYADKVIYKAIYYLSKIIGIRNIIIIMKRFRKKWSIND